MRIEKILIVGLLIYCFAFLIATQVRAENTNNSPAIRHYLSGDIILIENLSDTTLSSYSSGDTFENGLYSDTSGFEIIDNDNIKQYLELDEPTLKTYKPFEQNQEFNVFDEWLFDNENKSIKLIWKWEFVLSKWNKPMYEKIIKMVVKK